MRFVRGRNVALACACTRSSRGRVNCVAPGYIDTPLHQRVTPPEVRDSQIANVPMARMALPDECAGAYLFLASNTLSSYVTGHSLEVNGGWMMP